MWLDGSKIISSILTSQYIFYLLQVFFGSNQSGLGCVWTDIAPNYSSSLNSLGEILPLILLPLTKLQGMNSTVDLIGISCVHSCLKIDNSFFQLLHHQLSQATRSAQ